MRRTQWTECPAHKAADCWPQRCWTGIQESWTPPLTASSSADPECQTAQTHRGTCQHMHLYTLHVCVCVCVCVCVFVPHWSWGWVSVGQWLWWEQRNVQSCWSANHRCSERRPHTLNTEQHNWAFATEPVCLCSFLCVCVCVCVCVSNLQCCSERGRLWWSQRRH